jgi:hypothetical protein
MERKKERAVLDEKEKKCIAERFEENKLKHLLKIISFHQC